MFAKIGKGLWSAGGAAGRVLPTIIRDTAGLAAVGSIGYGAWLVTPAAGFITGGVLVAAGVILASMNKNRGA